SVLLGHFWKPVGGSELRSDFDLGLHSSARCPALSPPAPLPPTQPPGTFASRAGVDQLLGGSAAAKTRRAEPGSGPRGARARARSRQEHWACAARGRFSGRAGERACSSRLPRQRRRARRVLSSPRETASPRPGTDGGWRLAEDWEGAVRVGGFLPAASRRVRARGASGEAAAPRADPRCARALPPERVRARVPGARSRCPPSVPGAPAGWAEETHTVPVMFPGNLSFRRYTCVSLVLRATPEPNILLPACLRLGLS
ncbi:unnamed protein product, partial [Rangifer tarandus platyrhynchus]